jgi:endonuclease I
VSADDYSGACFEPPDDLKGDMARTYFYISTAYMNKFECCEEPAVSKWAIKKWQEDILRSWHALDPVDETEQARNEVIFTQFQHNRNPFIDHPEWVDQIEDF